jgi:hypothetical protein
MASSKILPGCLAAMLAVPVFYLSWVSLPSVRSESEVNSLVIRQQQAYAEDQKLAGDLQQNAFVDPQLAPFWGRKSVEHKAQSRASDVVTALRGFGFLGRDDGKGAALSALWAGKDPGLRAAAADFASFLPVLRKALRRKGFVVPGSELPGFDSEMANFQALRSLAQALSAYAEVQLADGKPSAALEAGLDMLDLARLVVGPKSHPLIMTLIASAIETSAQETLAYLLQSSNAWSENDLRRLVEALESHPVTPQAGLDSMEYELWVAHNAFQKPPETQYGKAVLLPGVWKREWRLFQNDFFPYVQAARAGQPLPAPATDLTALGWLLGQHSWMAQLMMPNFERVMSLLEISRQRQDFLHLYAELLLQKRQGKLPDRLTPELLKGLTAKSVSYRVEKGEPHLEYDLDARLARALPTSGARKPGAARWENLMQAHWVLPVAP